jgi:hypothetical protein
VRNGNDNPVPLGVDARYWQRVYNQADSAARRHIEAYAEDYCGGVGNKGKPDAVFKDSSAAEEIKEGMKWYRDEGKTHSIAVLFPVRDLVATAEGDFTCLSGRQGVRVKNAKSLKQTRDT